MLLHRFLRYFSRALCLVYFRIEFHGAERVPLEGPVIVAPNHASYLDPVWVSIPIRRQLRYMTWERIFRVPMLTPILRSLGAFPVKVDVGDRRAMRYSIEHLRSGGALMIFPEGARTKTGEMTQFKPGVIQLALATGARIVPVTIIGGYGAFNPSHRVPRPRKVKLYYHEPLELAPPEEEAEMKVYLRDQATRLREIVAASLPAGKGRGSAPPA